MDSLDMQIIEHLEKEGRISHEELSKRLNLSRPAIHNRVAKLEEKGIIKGYRASIDWTKLGYTTYAIISIKARTTDYDKLLEELKNIDIADLKIEECNMVTGNWGILMKVRCFTPMGLKAIQDELHKKECINETSTSLILSSLTD